jgi:predicted phage terminase large subunit-like protein
MNWYARPQDSGYFKRDWLQRCVEAPTDTKWVRAWDKAATEPSDTNPSPDYTACIKMGKDRAGNYYIAGDFVEENYDEDSKTYGRFRKRAGARDNIILKQALADGHDCEVVLPQDPAAAGKTEYIESAKKLIEQGIRCRKDVVASNKSKLIKFSPFSASCENGLVYILDATFTQKTLNAFYTELESFNGEASTRTRKDDWVDCTAMAFNYLSKKSVLPNFTLDEWGGTSVKTPLSIVRANFH